jgi:hypothetical protein
MAEQHNTDGRTLMRDGIIADTVAHFVEGVGGGVGIYATGQLLGKLGGGNAGESAPPPPSPTPTKEPPEES